METVNKREQCLSDIHALNGQLDESHQLSDEEQNAILDKVEVKLRELRALSIRCVELVVLWRDQFRYLALIGSK